jgi:hypothetical protein
LRLVDDIAEHCGALLAFGGLGQHLRRAVSIENVVAEHERSGIIADCG